MKVAEISLDNIIQKAKLRAEVFIPVRGPALSSEVPRKRLGELVCLSTAALDPPDFEPRDLYIGLENVEPVSGDVINASRISQQHVRSRAKTYSGGQILYGRLRPYLRKAALIPRDAPNGLCSTEFIVLEPRTDLVDPVFFRALLVGDYVTAQVTKLQAGSSLPRISVKDFLDIAVPVPPIKLQRALAQRLRELADERRQMLRQVERCALESSQLVADSIQSNDRTLDSGEIARHELDEVSLN